MDVLSLIYSFIFYFLGPLMWFRQHKASTWLLNCPFWRNTKGIDIIPKHFVNGRMCYYDIKSKDLLLVWANNFSLVCAFKIEDIRDYVISLSFWFCFSCSVFPHLFLMKFWVMLFITTTWYGMPFIIHYSIENKQQHHWFARLRHTYVSNVHNHSDFESNMLSTSQFFLL